MKAEKFDDKVNDYSFEIEPVAEKYENQEFQ